MLRISNANAWTEAHMFCLHVRRSARVVSAFLDIAEDLALEKLAAAKQVAPRAPKTVKTVARRSTR